MRMNHWIVKGILAAILLYVVIWQWVICRVYVPPGEMLVLISRMGTENPDPENFRVVDKGFKGVQKLMLAEGRHFIPPVLYEQVRTKVVTIAAEEIGVVRSKTGEPLPDQGFLVQPADDIYATKGIWRRVLTPGTWRLNPMAFDIEVHKATKIYPGYVGCVTALSGKDPEPGKLAEAGQRGIRRRVLQPGLYYFNPIEQKVDTVEVGYRALSLNDVSFPSKDGFPIRLDITVVWGLEPASVPSVMMHFGNVDQVVEKIIQPQVESICRIEGSRYGAKELIEGDSREQFQKAFTQTLTRVCEERKISVVMGLIRSIEIPMEIRQPIQQARVAMEERRTKEEQQITQGIVNQLSELQSDVEKGVREVAADTEKLVASIRAEGKKKVARIQAQVMVDVAVIDRQIAELTAQRIRELGKADSTVAKLAAEAEADLLKQNVDAIGGGDAYANFQFANNLPADLKILFRYSGAGTFWTDLPLGADGLRDAARLKILQDSK